ncbi:MAG: ABC transporter permease [Bacilli bacterium]|nr:ABC transporter permease [Bacilli bacterium]
MVENRVLSLEETNRALKRKAISNKTKHIFSLVFVYFFMLLIYSPLIYITIFAFTSAKTTGQWTGFDMKAFVNLFSGRNKDGVEIWNATLNTMIVALTSATLSVLLGTLGAIGIYYSRNKLWKKSLQFINQIPIVNAEIVTALSLCVLFISVARLETSFFTLIIGHMILSLPYVVLSVLPKLEQMDPSLYEAAMDLGATQRRALLTVVIPDILPGILSGFMLAVTLSLDDYVITAFTAPKDALWEVEVGGNFLNEFKTLSTYVEGTMKLGMPIELRSFTAILFGVILLVMIGMYIKNGVDIRKQKRIRKFRIRRN